MSTRGHALSQRKVMGQKKKKRQHLKEGLKRDLRRLEDLALGKGSKNWAMPVYAYAAW